MPLISTILLVLVMPALGGLAGFLVSVSGMSAGWGFCLGILMGAAVAWTAIWRARADHQ
jgi:hypothetical protein